VAGNREPLALADIPEKGAVIESIPEILEGKGQHALYVGASCWRSYMLADLQRWGWIPTVAEIWKENVDFLRTQDRSLRVLQIDISANILSEHFRLALWWHGPEHVALADLPRALANLENACDIVVLGCPAGHDPQGAYYGNPFERHLWDPQPSLFEAMGYSVRVDPRPGVLPNITAWKRVR